LTTNAQRALATGSMAGASSPGSKYMNQITRR